MEIAEILKEYGEEVSKAIVLQYEPELQAVTSERNEYKTKTETFSNLIALQAATIQERDARIGSLERGRLWLIPVGIGGLAVGSILTVLIMSNISR